MTAVVFVSLEPILLTAPAPLVVTPNTATRVPCLASQLKLAPVIIDNFYFFKS